MNLRTGIGIAVLGLLLVGCGGKSVENSVAGTYQLVKGPHVREAMKATLPQDAGPMADQLLKNMQSMIDGMALTTMIKPDGTFTVNGKMRVKVSASGTWKLEGDKLLMTATHEDGEKRDDPETSAWIVDGDTLRMAEKKEGQPFDIVLQRK